MDEQPKRMYSVAASFVVERHIAIEATSVEEAARFALAREYLEWGPFGDDAVGADSELASLDETSELVVETTREDGKVEETWVSLVEDPKSGDVSIAAVGVTTTYPPEIPHDITRHRRQWPTPKDSRDDDD